LVPNANIQASFGPYTPSFPSARLPNHKSEHLEHLRNKVIKINVKLLYEVYSPE